jgi:hypothetical protein
LAERLRTRSSLSFKASPVASIELRSALTADFLAKWSVEVALAAWLEETSVSPSSRR